MSCAAQFNNKVRQKSRRSKIEAKLFDLLQAKYPSLLLLPNDKTMLDGLEVDIGIPSLLLAIEWNGIVHFKPIYGSEKLSKVQQKDALKQDVARRKNINLIAIPDLVSTDKVLQQAFEHIVEIINPMIARNGI